MINRQDVAGNLGADAELKEIGENRFAVNFRVASNSKYLGKGNQVVEHTEWFRIRFYCSQRAALYFKERLLKGTLVMVSGRTTTDTYTDREGQEKETRYVECEVPNVHVLKDAKTDQPQAEHAPPRSSPALSGRTPSAATNTPAASSGPAFAPPSTARSDLMNFDA